MATTSRYLNSILRILPAIQAKQLSDLLNDLKATGEVRNAEEYQRKLQELATAINDTEPKPSFKQIRALTWHLATAEAHNAMMQALKNDLEAIFLQVDEMGEKIDDHHFLVMKNLAADMERGLADQENNIRRLEWLAGQNNEFSIALVNTFRSASLQRIPRSDFAATTLYFDNRTFKNKTEAELPSAMVSEHGEKLILGTTNEPNIYPLSAQLLTDSNSYGTQIQVDVDNNINNIIDGTRGTFWTRNIYLSQAVAKVTTVIQFNLGTARDVDYMIIEGAVDTPFSVDSIDAIYPDGHIINLSATSVEVNGRTRIDFAHVIVKAVKVTFSVKSYSRAEYFTDPKSTIISSLNPTDQFDEVTRARDLGAVASEVISSEYLGNLLNVPSGTNKQINSYLYSFALDNVWFGDSKYEDSGVFVSKPLKGNNFGVIAVRANETIASTDVRSSIEYDIIRRDISPKFKETRFPIPKLNQTSVISERLVLTKRDLDSTINDVGVLRFCPWVDPDYNALTDTDPVIVYKNGIQLTKGHDYQLAIRTNVTNDNFEWVNNFVYGDSDTRSFSNYTLKPAKMWLKIFAPDSSAVYTANYTIRTSDTYIDDNTVWLDKDKTIFVSEGGKIYFKRENPDITVESELYLQITLRRNTASQTISPELHEYALLGATYND